MRVCGELPAKTTRRASLFRLGLAVCSVGAVLLAGSSGAALASPAAHANHDATVKNGFAVYPVAVGGLARHSNGSTTLWLLNIQTKPVVVSGSDIFGVDDVQFTGAAGAKYRIKSGEGNNCAITKYPGSPPVEKVECLPNLAPGELVPLVTFTSTEAFPSKTFLVNTPEQSTYTDVASVPSGDRTPASIRQFLESYAKSLHLRDTVVFVTITKSKPFTFVLSQKSAPTGWVTFVFKNYSATPKTFEICQYSGVLGDACQGAASDPNEDATAMVTTGNADYFAILLTPGKALYLSWEKSQAVQGLKGIFTVTK